MASEFIHCQAFTALDAVVVTVKHWLDEPASSTLTPFTLPVFVASGTCIRTHRRYCAVSGAATLYVAVPMTPVVEHRPAAARERSTIKPPMPAKARTKSDKPTNFDFLDAARIFWILFFMASFPLIYEV